MRVGAHSWTRGGVGGRAEEKWTVKQALLMLQQPLVRREGAEIENHFASYYLHASPERRETDIF